MSDAQKAKELLPDILAHHKIVEEKIASINVIITNFEKKWDASEGEAVPNKGETLDSKHFSPVDEIYRGMDGHEKELMKCISRLQTLQERYLGA